MTFTISIRTFMTTLLMAGSLAVAGGDAAAQSEAPPRASHCISLVEEIDGARLWRADFRDPLPEDTVRLNYVAHASFLLQAPDGVQAVTDYTGFLGSADVVPDIATMNRAHSSHWTSSPDPRIPHVLPGWGADSEGIDHHLEVGEMLVRNVTTDIRSRYGEAGINANSIFIFETAGLCIGHLGHLHHALTPQQAAAIGRLDVVMAPVDGGLTLALPTMIDLLKRLRASVVIPMHWFGEANLQRFLAGMSDAFAIDRNGGSSLEVSLRDLPERPTVVVLRPAYLSDGDE